MSHTDFLMLGYGVPALLLLAELVMLARQRRRQHDETHPIHPAANRSAKTAANTPADPAEEDKP